MNVKLKSMESASPVYSKAPRRPSFKRNIASLIKSVGSRSRSGSAGDFNAGKLTYSDDRQPIEGLLYKYTNVMKGWQYRWFALDPNTGQLMYFEKEEHKNQRPRGSVYLAGAVISPSDEDSQTFNVNAANGEIYRLRALDAKERQHWVNRLRATAEHHTDTIAQNAPPISREARQQAAQSPQSLKRETGSQESLNSSTTVSVRSHHKTTIPPQTPTSLKQAKELLSQIQYEAGVLQNTIEELPYIGEHISPLDKDLLVLKATTGATVNCLEQCYQTLQQNQHAVNHNMSQAPSVQIEWLDPRQAKQDFMEGRASSPAESYVSATSSVPEGFPIERGRPNSDEEEEDPAEYQDTDLGAVEEHKSIILHLLSQLKLGMDLTKVVLPTFILEKRSLLEMFADCMAHPDKFIRIPDLKSPEDRILEVLEWYLTSFHASRKGSIAKKPYNPIIGETFHCSWTVPPAEQSTSPATMKDMPGEDVRLYYSAEQVSHHPPVSAFYFECPQKQMYLNASIWTKSKFMGMSIGVQMVGKLNLHLSSLNEDYVFTLPSAYARSILTVPWSEMGDRVNITCQQTGYSAAVTFHTKPFYGGKLHRISSEVKNGSGEITCKVAGEWNGQIEFQYANGSSKIIDTKTLKTWRKRVRPLARQGDFESRKLWHKVTESLKRGDITNATNHKQFLEERQRQGERHRKETNTSFPTKFFHKDEESWVYNDLLKPVCKEEQLINIEA